MSVLLCQLAINSTYQSSFDSAYDFHHGAVHPTTTPQLEGRGEEVLEEVYNIYVAYLAASEGLNEVTAAIANRSSKDRKKGDEEEDEGDYTYKAYYVRPRRVGASSVAQTSRIACDVNNNNNNNNDDKKKEKDDNFDDNNGGAGEEEEEEEEEEEDEERRWVKVRESNSLISRGTTGLSVWQVGQHLIFYFKLVIYHEYNNIYNNINTIQLVASKLYRVDATIIIFVFVSNYNVQYQ